MRPCCPGAVLTRVAASHIRVGTFQFFAARRDTEGLQRLADHVIARHYPDVAEADAPALALLDAVIARQAGLVAQWMGLGFIHGVMNTDNMTISGETIDYGPCAFMDAFHPGRVYSSIDQGGRYAFGNQPRIAQWNLVQLAQSLLPLFPEEGQEAVDLAQASIDRFPDLWLDAWQSIMRAKLGLTTVHEGDQALIEGLLERMTDGEADFTLTFRKLGDLAVGLDGPRDHFKDPAEFDTWAETWLSRIAQEGGDPVSRRTAMRSVNPSVIPRNHLVEAAISAAMANDLEPFEQLLKAVARPFDDPPDGDRYTLPPGP